MIRSAIGFLLRTRQELTCAPLLGLRRRSIRGRTRREKTSSGHVVHCEKANGSKAGPAWPQCSSIAAMASSVAWGTERLTSVTSTSGKRTAMPASQRPPSPRTFSSSEHSPLRMPKVAQLDRCRDVACEFSRALPCPLAIRIDQPPKSLTVDVGHLVQRQDRAGTGLGEALDGILGRP
jgi:hypothetical protein